LDFESCPSQYSPRGLKDGKDRQFSFDPLQPQLSYNNGYNQVRHSLELRLLMLPDLLLNIGRGSSTQYDVRLWSKCTSAGAACRMQRWQPHLPRVYCSEHPPRMQGERSPNNQRLATSPGSSPPLVPIFAPSTHLITIKPLSAKLPRFRAAQHRHACCAYALVWSAQ